MPRKPAAPKAHPETGTEGLAAKAEAEANAPGAAEVQANVDKATAQGFVGVEVDETPNENYTVAGVLLGVPTPETDPLTRAQRDGVIRST